MSFEEDVMLGQSWQPSPTTGWRQAIQESAELPIVVVTGSRGKSTVVRLLESICQAAGMKTASWTSQGVTIGTERQRGELGPWRRVLAGLADRSLDVAFRELDWATSATTAREETLPMLVVANLCANREACLIQGEAKLAAKTLPHLLGNIPAGGVAILNGEDYAVSGDHIPGDQEVTLVGLSAESPLIANHLERQGNAAWLSGRSMVVGMEGRANRITEIERLRFALDGAASFQVQNALIAAATATALGIGPAVIGQALESFESTPRSLPGSFNIFRRNGVTAIVDCPAPSWYLRSTFRAVRPHNGFALRMVLNDMPQVPFDDLAEIGRLAGINATEIVLVGRKETLVRLKALRQGALNNEFPPVVTTARLEGPAISRLWKRSGPGDQLLIVSDKPMASLSALRRAGSAQLETPGTLVSMPPSDQLMEIAGS